MTGPERQFVVQEHTTQAGVHWDLMLQMDDMLWTWRVAVSLEQMLSEPVVAERILDHPLRFLSYEGPVQNQTGSVRIAERGKYWLENDVEWDLELHFESRLLKGRYKLTEQDSPHWLLSPLPRA
jgi:hypothetical protein